MLFLDRRAAEDEGRLRRRRQEPNRVGGVGRLAPGEQPAVLHRTSSFVALFAQLVGARDADLVRERRLVPVEQQVGEQDEVVRPGPGAADLREPALALELPAGCRRKRRDQVRGEHASPRTAGPRRRRRASGRGTAEVDFQRVLQAEQLGHVFGLPHRRVDLRGHGVHGLDGRRQHGPLFGAALLVRLARLGQLAAE